MLVKELDKIHDFQKTKVGAASILVFIYDRIRSRLAFIPSPRPNAMLSPKNIILTYHDL